MSEPLFDIAFYGIIQTGKDKESIIGNMASLFKTSPDKVRPYFSGGRMVIKSGVDELTAEKYANALENIGLVIKLETLTGTGEAEEGAQERPLEESDQGDITVAPVGADVLENPPVVEPRPIADISAITLAEVGADVLENPPLVEPQPIGDIGDVTLAEVGADLLENPPAIEPRPIGDISDITLAEVGADAVEKPKPEK